MSKKVLMVLAEGFEEIEAITPIDVLRRANIDVTVAGLKSKVVTGAHGISVETDILFGDYRDTPDAIVLPGGMPGSKNLGESVELKKVLQYLNKENKIIAAICAAPALALSPSGVLDGRKATCYPGYEKNISGKAKFVEDRVVCDQNIVTSRGPGTAAQFALELVAKLVGRETADQLKRGMLIL